MRTEKQLQRIRRFLYAIALVATTLALRLQLLRWTGVGAPFLLFFFAVLTSSFLWGVGPGLFAGLLSSVIGGFLFVYEAHFTLSQTLVQSLIFFSESLVVCLLANRFAHAKQRAELNETIAQKRLDELRIFRTLIENSPDFIGIADPEGKPTWINPAGRQMAGLEPDVPVENTAIPDYYPPEHRAFAADVIVKSMLKRGYWKGETYLRNWKTEKAIPVSDHHFLIREPVTERTLGIATITRDISDVKRVEATLRERETELKEAQRVAHVGSWMRDMRGDVVYWSEEIYRVFDWDPGQKPPGFDELNKVYTPESLARLRPALDRVMKEGIPYEMDLQVVRRNGAIRWVATRAEPVRDDSGRITRLRGVAQDVTELRELQAMREEWTSVIAHDLRQPIGVIRMNADLLRRSNACESIEKNRLACVRIQSAASTLSRMVNDLLDVSQLEAHRLQLDRKWLDPRILVRETVDRLAFLTSEFRVKVEEGGELIPVFADPTRIEQVLGNLISNAVKYGDKGSEIRIRMEEQHGEVKISVTNQGRGVPPDDLSKIFSRFTRSRLNHGTAIPGLGLGLYISKGLVEAHGGRIGVESTPGQTTTFHFTLPTRIVLAKKTA